MKNILLIEDDAALRENTAELLELSNYKVSTAPNGSIGIERAQQELPDLIICDIMMPETDGYGVLQKLSEKEETRYIPFVFLSAKTEPKEVRKGMNMGADDYLTKPYDEEDLLNAVESRLAKSTILKESLAAVPEKPSSDEDHEDLRNLHELKNFFDDYGKSFTFRKGDIIYKKGEHANMIYLILSGVVKTHSIDENGKELITTLYRPDDFLGFTSFIENIPHRESATAVEKVELAGVSKKELKDILEHNKNLSLEMMNILTDNLSEIKAQLLQMAYSSVRKKTAQTILQFVEVMAKKPGEAIKITRSDLASVAGIATESLIRTLSSFKKENLIEIDGRTIKVLDAEGLELIE